MATSKVKALLKKPCPRGKSRSKETGYCRKNVTKTKVSKKTPSKASKTKKPLKKTKSKHSKPSKPSKSKPVKKSPSKSNTKIMSLDEIRASLPASYSLGYSNAQITPAAVKSAFGKYAKPLTTKLAKSLEGQTVNALVGQNYLDAVFEDGFDMRPFTKDARVKLVTKLRVKELKGENLELDDLKQKFDFEAYLYKNTFVTGGGADMIFVFVK